MAKKQETATPAEAVAAPAVADEVQVGMTKEQLDQFVRWKAAEDSKKAAKDQAGVKVRMNLAFGHNINGVRFGPGEAVVPEELAGLLQQHEFNARDAELALYQSKDRMFKLMGAGSMYTATEVKSK